VPDDVKFNSKARRLITANWLDISQIRVRTVRAVVHLQGHVQRIGEDPRNPEANEPFLFKLDEQLRSLPGFRGAHYTFDNWTLEPTGTWRFTGRKPKGGR
jgi:hypothetical protein